MTIYLPTQTSTFRSAYNSTCERILGSETDEAFYSLLIELVSILKVHPLTKEFIADLEAKSDKKREEFSISALEALEDKWTRLWKCHPNLKHRKQLIQIKRTVTDLQGPSYSSPYNSIRFQFFEFCYSSPICRACCLGWAIFRGAQSDRYLDLVRLNHLCASRGGYFAGRKTVLLKLNQRDKIQELHRATFATKPAMVSVLNQSVSFLFQELHSLKIEEVNQRFCIQGVDSFQKRKTMQILAEIDPAFCWDRFRFLLLCSEVKKMSPASKPMYGRWSCIREKAWRLAQERHEQKAKIIAMQSRESYSCIDPFLDCEYQIYRRDLEKYLGSMKNHIHAHLLRIEDLRLNSSENNLLLPGTQKGDFVIDLAPKFWKENPQGNRDDAFAYYKEHCPPKKCLKRERWDQIVRERKLDPRLPETRRRGPGKKPVKNNL